MSTSNADGRQALGLDPQALRLVDLARILTTLGAMRVSVEMLDADIAAGAPTNPDGTVNLVHYASWLVKEMAVAH
jgi:uncharacterized ferredoxin-like protein